MKHLTLTLAIATTLLTHLPASAQDLRTTLFADTDSAFEEARQNRVPLLAPDNFEEAAEYLERAEEDVRRGRSIERIKENLAEANRYLRAAREASELARVTFESTLKVRAAAEAAQAARLASEQWEDAEEWFYRAASALEDGNVNRARDYAGRALSDYRDAELTAIQGAILNEARRLIAEAEEKDADRYAPKTLGRAKALVARAAVDLEKARYDTEVPRAMARDAEYAAEHASYLAGRVEAVRDDEQTVEELILDWEQPLLAIAKQLDSSTDLSNGYEPVRDASISRIENLQSTVAEQREQIDSLNLRVLDLEQSLGMTTQRAAAEERRRERIARLEQLFDPTEARILREGDSVIIRLIGLQFDSGKAVIESRYFGLLRKLTQVADLYPNNPMIIEGHTDSVGSDQLNLTLSERRANSVRDYLLANTVLGASQVEAVGYGESRPIANNESAEGRALNRRIDVVILPE